MAEECSESSVATSSSIPNWWPDLHASSLSSWSANTTNQWQPLNPNSNSSCEEDVSISTTSFTNASNHSGLSVDSSRRLFESASTNELIGETASVNHHLWNHVLLSARSSGQLNNSQDVGEKLPTGMFEPAFDYLKKMDNSWEFTNSASFNNFEKHSNGFNESLIESERPKKQSNLVSNWSIAPPDPEVNISLSSTLMDQYYSRSDLYHVKQMVSDSINSNFGSFLCCDHDLKVENDYHEIEGPEALFRRSFNGNGIGYQMSLNNSLVGDNSKYYYGIPDMPCNNPTTKSLNLSDCKKQLLPTSAPTTIATGHTLTRSSGRRQGITNEGKKKRTEVNSETVLKKPKHENSTVSSTKTQVPKVKLGDKITALQQIVSPFGKTDASSVLWEAIGYIKFLQEQVQLLSNPYMKTNASKDPWGGLELKDRGDAKFDLKSRGLCLVPISCTPQVCRENTGSDYWTPTHRGCPFVQMK
uniref:BHLH domain-containing protein n=1 Tax=Davidia involucrata TaxID=16924 RepID=A0A5B7BDD8_DAVIN